MEEVRDGVGACEGSPAGRPGEQAFVDNLAAGDRKAGVRLAEQLRTELDGRPTDCEGLRVFAKAFRGQLFAFLVHKQFEGDHDAALDAWNDTLVRVRTRVGSYEPTRSAFRTWAWNQAACAALSLRRNWRRWRMMERLTDWPDRAADGGDPVALAERAALSRAFGRLRMRDRQLLYYRFVEDWKPSELVSELFTEMSAGQVRVAVHRALERVRRLYLEELNGTTADASVMRVRALRAESIERLFVGDPRRADGCAADRIGVCFADGRGVAALTSLSDEDVAVLCRSLAEAAPVSDAELQREVERAVLRACVY
jgi:RNA polymerase sigma factor (sigma-70 family)